MPHNLRPELERFRHWLGLWRGVGTMGDGNEVLLEFSFRPLLEGCGLEVTSSALDIRTGACLTTGLGFWGVDAKGKVVAGIFTPELGPVQMHEVPDDPAGVCIEAMVAGNIRFTVALILVGSDLVMATRRNQGYAGQGTPVTSGTLHRATPQWRATGDRP
jgi:hypothetical protein